MDSPFKGHSTFSPGLAFSETLECFPDPTFAIDLHGTVTAWNRAMVALTGVRAENMLGKGDYEYAIPFYGHRRPISIDLVLKWDAAVADNYRSCTRQGEMVICEVEDLPFKPKPSLFRKKSRRICNADGVCIGAIQVIQDITERKKAEDKHAQEIIERQRTETRLLETARAFGKVRMDKKQIEEQLWNREKCLVHYIELLQLIAQLSTRFANSTAATLDHIINQMLAEVGIFTGVEQSYVFQFSDDLSTGSNTHEWCAEGVALQGKNFQNIPAAPYNWWMQHMLAGKNIVIPSVSDLPPEAGAEKAVMQTIDIRSLFVVPVKCGKLIGFLGFSNVNREKNWSEEDKQLLQTLAEMVGTVILREREERALRESEQRFRTFMQSNVIGVVFADLIGGAVMEANEAYLRIIGRSREELHAGKINWKEITPKEILAGQAKALSTLKVGEPIRTFEKEYLRPDGQRVPVIVGGVIEEGGQRAIAYVLDNTDRKKAEEILKKEHDALEKEVKKRTAELEWRNAEIRELAHKTIIAMENDRKALSKELHDSVCGTLAAIKHQLESRVEHMGKLPPDSAVMPLEKLIEYLALTITEARRITKQLRPLVLDDLGLTAAVDQYIREYKQFNPSIKVRLRMSINDEKLSSDVKTVLYRVLQEALNNVGKHSRASEVYVRCHRYKAMVKLKVKDDGIGFDVCRASCSTHKMGAFGLQSMKERVELCKGEFQIKSALGQGTIVLASLPVQVPS
jgi:PAS domain S-box-containing protein